MNSPLPFGFPNGEDWTKFGNPIASLCGEQISPDNQSITHLIKLARSMHIRSDRATSAWQKATTGHQAAAKG